MGNLAQKARESAEARYALKKQVRAHIFALALDDWDGKLNTKSEGW